MTRVLALLIALAAAPSAAGARVALLPLEDQGGGAGAEQVSPLLEAELARRGWEVASGEPVARALEERRVRYLDSLSGADREALLSGWNADAYLAGTVHTWAAGRDSVVALSARLVGRDGQTLWSGAAGLSAEETPGLLGLGRADELPALARRAVRDLCRSLPAPSARARSRGGSGPFLRAGARTFVSASLPEGARLAILPLASQAEAREAPRVAETLLAGRLAGSGRFGVVESADVRAALVSAKLRGIRGLEPSALRELGERLGTTLFLTGTIWAWRDGNPATPASLAEAEIELTLIDAATGRILWTSHLARRGEEYRGLFLRGAVKSVVVLADRMLGEMVAAAGRTTPTKTKGGSPR